jgi:hypothetical protein
MSYIAHLDLAINHSLRETRWSALAAESGTPIRDYDAPPGNLESVAKFIRDAAGMILPYENFLLTPELRTVIHECVAAGHRMLAIAGQDNLEVLNPFLENYGVAGTRLAVHDSTSKLHPRLVELDRGNSPDSFRPHPLNTGVQSLVVQHPYAIRYQGNTKPVITLPLDRIDITDQRADLHADWTAPDLSCLVLSPVGEEGGLLSISCSLFSDPYVGPMGDEFPGIEAADNKVLASNILKWLGGKSLQVANLSSVAFDLLDRIERSLVEFTQFKLKNQMADWWTDGVPVSIRVECAKRREEEGRKMPMEAYFDLIAVKTILEGNWVLFESDLAVVGWKGGKRAALSWFDQLNTIRRNVMHPTRRHFVPDLVDSSAVAFLRELWDRVQRLGVRSAVVH